MANDKYIQEVETRFTTSGVAESESALRKIQSLVDSETRAGNLSEKQSASLSRANARLSNQLGDTAQAHRSVKSATDEVSNSQIALGNSLAGGERGFVALRYAMYDVARTAGTVSAAFTGIGAGIIAASSSYESSFTAVERTSGATGSAVQELRGDLLDLSRAIPQSFGEISDLAARGAQLGIASDQLDNFTETVAQFVATSDTVTSGQAVEAFGRISNLLGDTDFNRIGSAITLVGVNAAATEGQIVKTTQELAPFGAAAGLASDEVIGLATALASLGQPPERARSAFLSLQAVMDNAVAGLNDKLPVFSDLLGKTSDEVANLWKSDPSAFIASFVDALGATDNLTVALSELGLNEKRATQVFQALAADSANAGDGLSVLNQAFADSEKGYTEGTELARQYGLIIDDLASKWQLFVNGVGEVASALGDILAPAAKTALDILTNMVQGIADFARTPLGKVFYGVSLAIGGLVAVAAGLLAALALGVASVAAFRTAIEQLGLAGGRTAFSLRALSASLTETAIAAGVSSRAINVFKTALVSTGIGAVVVALGTLAAAFINTGASAEQAFESYVGNTGGLSEALAADQLAYQEAVSQGNQALADQFIQIGSASQQAAAGTDSNNRAMEAAAGLLGVTLPATDSLTGAIQGQTSVLGENSLAWLSNSLIQSDAFQKLASNADFVATWEQYGLSISDVLEAAAENGEQGVLDLFTRMGNAANNGAGVFANGIAGFFIRLSDSWNHYWSNFAESAGRQWEALMQGDFGKVRSIGTGAVDSLFAGWDKIWSSPTLNTGVRDFAKAVSGGVATVRELDSANRSLGGAFQDVEDGSDGAAQGIEDAGNAAQGAAEKVYTLVDYANDLSSVWKRAFDIRFSGQQTLDTIQDSLQKVRDAAAASANRVRDLRTSIGSLTAGISGIKSDIGILEYYLKIAREYGDTKRATALEAELAKKRAELAEKTKELSNKSKDLKKEQDSQSKSLVGNSQAARDNRKTIQDLVQQYQAHIEKLAASGMSQDDLAKATQRLKEDFIKQATQLGYNRAELDLYARSFDDVAVAISNVPRNITVRANANPALQALNEFKAKASSTMKAAGVAAKNAFNSGVKGIGATIPQTVQGTTVDYSRSFPTPYKSWSAFMDAVRKAGFPYTKLPGDYQRLAWLGSGMGFQSGGYTGRGAANQAAGTVHKGEYVLRKDQVNQSTGLPYASALGQLMGGLPSRSVAPSASASSSGTPTVALSAATIQAIAQATGKNIYLDGRLIAASTHSQNTIQNEMGAF